MTKKQIRDIARTVANSEKIIQSSSDPDEIKKAEMAIIQTCFQVSSMEDMIQIDELIQKYLEKKV